MLVFLLAVIIGVHGGELLSLNKPTSASSIGHGGTNEGVVNGNTDGSFTNGECSHSEGTTNNWWQVDLGDSAGIDTVVLYNRVDCCSDRIDGAEVFVGDALCGTVAYVSGQSVYQFDCGGIEGASVKVVQENNYLTLCEVQVYGATEYELLLLMNRPTSASSVAWGGTNEGVVNGNTDGSFTNGECSHTSETSGNWWQVDLGDSTTIDKIVIYNRDSNQDRIDGAEVFVGHQSCGTIVYVSGQSAYVMECGGIAGDFVRVEQDNNYLTLCEVQVYGVLKDIPEYSLSLSHNKVATSNSVGLNGDPGLAVDGNTSGDYADGSCANSEGSSSNWWQVDLLSMATVETIRIYNREDCCQDRIDGAQVYVGTQLCGAITYVPGQSSYQLYCGGMEGNSVKVEQNSNYLTLCEVQVYGSYANDVENLGCWEDSGDRAIPYVEDYDSATSYTECKALALDNGFSMFALQSTINCYMGLNAVSNYNMYGSSTACNTDGTGGSWANQVYRIKSLSDTTDGVENLGCWKDKSTRAIPMVSDGLQAATVYMDCKAAAEASGYPVFAVQGSGCFTGPNAVDTYKKYGPSNDCNEEGTGGGWSNQVYRIEGIAETSTEDVEHLGCWEDKDVRAITIVYDDHPEHIYEDCKAAALANEWPVFAVQNGEQCYSDAGAANTYDMYGTSTGCNSAGTGGGWANQVYLIKELAADDEEANGVLETDMIPNDDVMTEVDPAADVSSTWCEYPDSYVGGYCSGTYIYTDLASAQAACIERDDCGGVTQEPYNYDHYTLRSGTTVWQGASLLGETTWVTCSQEGTTVQTDCTITYPFPFLDGDYCCKYNVDCNDDIIADDSGCCYENEYIACSDPPCKKFMLYDGDSADYQCAMDYPFPYNNNEYCCRFNAEGIDAATGETCDGGYLDSDSTCCFGNLWFKCHHSPCVSTLVFDDDDDNAVQVVDYSDCSADYPFTFLSGEGCCKYNLDCNGNEIIDVSACCYNDEYWACPEPPCSCSLEYDDVDSAYYDDDDD